MIVFCQNFLGGGRTHTRGEWVHDEDLVPGVCPV